MFRASLRSVSDPLRDHVCLSCLARRFGVPNRLRSFHSKPVFIAKNKKIGPCFGPKPLFRGYSVATQESPSENHNEKVPETPSTDSEGSSAQATQTITVGSAKESEVADADKKAARLKRNRKERARQKRAKQRKLAELAEARRLNKKTEVDKKGIGKGKTRKRHAWSIWAEQRRRAALAEAQTDKKTDADKQDTDKQEAKEQKEEEAASSMASAVPTSQPPGKEDVNQAPVGATAKPEPRQRAPWKTKRKEEETPESTGQQDEGSLYAAQPLTPLNIPLAPVPSLSFGLERVLFNPGVYHLRDPRSRVYNFDPYLGSIMPVAEFDFDALKAYITSSKDEALRDVAVKQQKKYVGSSSSMTSVLSHFHYLLSSWRAVNTNSVSQGFPDKMRTFTRLLRSPAATFLRYQDGVYAIDADKEFDSANILMNLGKSMEKLLTMPKEDFERYRRSHENKITPEEEEAIPESYHFTTYGDFIMRSQLDAYDPRLPGTGMFDLKTRAVVSIRMDATNYENGLGYEIKNRFGDFESFEREYFDMIRAAFLKYSLQVRVGRMDGIFVAFHNVERIFGFQYISLAEMDEALHGQSDTALGDAEFKLSLGLWNKVLDKATARFPKQSLRFHFETRDTASPFMYIFAEPVTDEEIDAIQTRSKAEIDAYQKRLLHPEAKDLNPPAKAKKLSPSETSKPETLSSNATTPESPFEPSSAPIYDSDAPPDPSFIADIVRGDDGSSLLGMMLTIKNQVNRNPVERPINFKATDEWTVDYKLTDVEPSRARILYEMCQHRRREILRKSKDEDGIADATASAYFKQLHEISKQGRLHREKENEVDKEKGIVVFDDPVN